MKAVIGIDVGTTGTKSGLFTVDGSLLALTTHEYALDTPQEGWVEQHCCDWWVAVCATVQELQTAVPEAQIEGLSLSTQGGAWVPLDRQCRPLRAAMSWMDKRASEVGRQFEGRKGKDWIYRLSGWSFGGGLPFLLTCWLRDHEPLIFSQTHQFADTHAFVAHRLTGELATDHSNAAITQFYDLPAARWSDELCRLAGIEERRLPRLARAGDVLGTLTREAAAELGLPSGIPVAAGGHDQYCAALGAGVTQPGGCLLSSGTAWVALIDSDELLFDPTRRVSPGTHVVPGHWGLLTSVPVAGAALKWFRDGFLPGGTYDALSRQADGISPGSDGLLFVPRNYRDIPNSAFLGVDLLHTPPHFARAIMEGVALAVRRNVQAIDKLGAGVTEMTMIGGGAKSSCWPQIVSDVCARPVVLPDQTEAACAGAAALAGIGSGIFPNHLEAAQVFASRSRTVEPTPANAALYEERYAQFLNALG